MKTQEALKLALEALTIQSDRVTEIGKQREAIIAIKEALAQTERHELQAKSEHPAPCARHCEATAFGIVIKNLKAQLAQPTSGEYALGYVEGFNDACKPQPQQKPMAWLSTDSIGERHLCFDKPLDNDPVQPLYTTPPQRTWVGLTDEEIAQGCKESWVTEQAWQSAVWWAEAKLKQKNT